MKIVVIASLAESLINFREEFLLALIKDGYEVVAFAPGNNSFVEEKLNKNGIVLESIPLQNTSLNPVKDIFTIGYIFWLLRKHKADIVFNYTVKPVIYGSIAARFAGVSKTFSMITGLGFSFIGKELKSIILQNVVSLLYRIALRKNKQVFFQNPDDMRLFVENKLVRNSQSILVAGSGINLSRFTESEIFNKPTVFLLIARLLKDKGIFEYIDAARIIKTKYNDVIFQLLGPIDSNPSAVANKQIREWENEGVIDYLGETTDVRTFIARSNVFVLPSYREGTPRSVLEAMAMGRPVITTDVPGCRETVIDGENGFLVPARNIAALVKAMEKFILKPELIPRMGKISRKIAEEKYDIHKVNSLIITVIKSQHGYVGN